MRLLIEEELESSLVREGLRELPNASRAWIYRKLAVAGLSVGSWSVDTAAVERPEVRAAARALIAASHRVDLHAAPLGSFQVGDIVSTILGPSADAIAKYAELQADWEFFHTQGVDKYPDLATDVTEWNQFVSDWDSGSIDSTDLSGRLNAEIVRANRVRATLLEKASGQTVFVQDLPPDQKIANINTEDTSAALSAAQAVDDWVKEHPFLDALTNPAGPAIKIPGLPKLPGGIPGGLGILAAAAVVLFGAYDITKSVFVAKITRQA